MSGSRTETKTSAREPESDGAAAHYARWPFPGTAFLGREGLILLRRLSSWFREAAGEGDRPRALDAGCGTGETLLALARRFPEADFVGLDVSAPSLQKARVEAQRRGLDNIHFVRRGILGRNPSPDLYDVVLCLGVLHHIRPCERALARLAAATRPAGRLVLWLYGRHGRARHALNLSFLRLLDAGRSPADRLALARTFLDELGARFAEETGFYTPRGSGPEGIAWLRAHPEWLADQFLNAYEHPWSLDEVLDLFDRQDLVLEEWLGAPSSLGELTESPALVSAFERLDERSRWLALDCLLKPAGYLLVARRR